jgi:glucosamine 6-phosphate synthetase-like amidotransferase/phosphosugar isomerase protein
MCSIFGYIRRRPDSPFPLETLERIVAANIDRGPHAFGLAWVDAAGQLCSLKRPGRFTDNLHQLKRAAGCVMLVGHLRWATHGSPSDNRNNHPHPIDDGLLVHNGIVRNYEDLVAAHGLATASECDSEAIGLLAERLDGSRARRLAGAVNMTEGCLAVLGIWSGPSRIIAARRGNPLQVADTPHAKFLATRLAGCGLGKVYDVNDSTVADYTFTRTGALHVALSTLEADTHHQLPPDRGGRRLPAGAGRQSQYAGG